MSTPLNGPIAALRAASDHDPRGEVAPEAVLWADNVGAGLSAVAAEAWRLVRSGRRLRIATDHGWLLLPGGLPVASLPSGLTVTKWRRCAVVKEGAI